MIVLPSTASAAVDTRPLPVVSQGHSANHDPASCPICSQAARQHQKGAPPQAPAATARGEPGVVPYPVDTPDHGMGPQVGADGVLWLPTLPPGLVVSTERADPALPPPIRRAADVRRRMIRAYGDEAARPAAPARPHASEPASAELTAWRAIGELSGRAATESASASSREARRASRRSEAADGDGARRTARPDSRVRAYLTEETPASGSAYSVRM